jgi:hypothetical protein
MRFLPAALGIQGFADAGADLQRAGDRVALW